MSLLLSEAGASFALSLAVKATALLAVAALAALVLARLGASAAARHLVWVLAVAGLLALLLLSALPGWRVGLLPSIPAAGVLQPSPAGGTGHPEPPSASPENPVQTGGPARAVAAPSGRAGLGWGEAAAAVYLAGMLALLARLAAGQWGVRRLERRSRPLDGAEWTGLLRDLAWALDVRRPVRLLRGEGATMPLTWGTRRPAVLLPAEAEGGPRSGGGWCSSTSWPTWPGAIASRRRWRASPARCTGRTPAPG